MNLKAIGDDLSEFDGVSKLKGYVSTKELEKERITQAKEDRIPMGLSTGSAVLDMHFLFKKPNLVIINGHANVGKSFGIWYLAVISAKMHGWRWIMYCGENQSADIRRQIAEFFVGKLAKQMNEVEFNEALDFAYRHFELIELDDSKEEIETADMILKITEDIIEEKGCFDSMLIDPYNSLQVDMSKLEKRLSTHDYHYLIATKFRKFKKKHNISVWVSMHAVSEALRRADKNGFPLPPREADTEGGGKFTNRADEFLTFHRVVQDLSRNTQTEIHVRKVKDTYTGGKPSGLDAPIIWKWETHNGFYGFYDDQGICPLAYKSKSMDFKVEKLPVTDSLGSFDSEAPF